MLIVAFSAHVRVPMFTIVVSLALGACTGEDPPQPPLEIPSMDVFNRLTKRAPRAAVTLPLTLDTKSCSFARYAQDTDPQPFVLIHPLRTQCELWLGRSTTVLQYCRFPREELVEIDASLGHVFRILEEEHCTLGAGPSSI